MSLTLKPRYLSFLAIYTLQVQKGEVTARLLPTIFPAQVGLEAKGHTLLPRNNVRNKASVGERSRQTSVEE